MKTPWASVMIACLVVAPVRAADDVPGPGTGGTGRVVEQAADGIVTLHARDCTVHGTTLRYEPQPNKQTVGYWTNVDDWVSWKCRIDKPEYYAVEILQGCGAGHGGSEIEVSIGGYSKRVIVRETGHFQAFVARQVMHTAFAKPGEETLTVKAIRKANGAVMDLRQVRLLPFRDGPIQSKGLLRSSVVGDDPEISVLVETWPDNGVVDLPASDRHVTRVRWGLPSEDYSIRFQTDKGLRIHLGERDPGIRHILIKLEVRNGNQAAQLADGCIEFPAQGATIHGNTAKLESDPGSHRIGYWTNADDWLSWDVEARYTGRYHVELTSSSAQPGDSDASEYEIRFAGQTVKGVVPGTGGWWTYATRRIGEVTIDRPGKYTLELRPTKKVGPAVMNMKAIVLRPIDAEPAQPEPPPSPRP